MVVVVVVAVDVAMVHRGSTTTHTADDIEQLIGMQAQLMQVMDNQPAVIPPLFRFVMRGKSS